MIGSLVHDFAGSRRRGLCCLVLPEEQRRASESQAWTAIDEALGEHAHLVSGIEKRRADDHQSLGAALMAAAGSGGWRALTQRALGSAGAAAGELGGLSLLGGLAGKLAGRVVGGPTRRLLSGRYGRQDVLDTISDLTRSLAAGTPPKSLVLGVRQAAQMDKASAETLVKWLDSLDEEIRARLLILICLSPADLKREPWDLLADQARELPDDVLLLPLEPGDDTATDSAATSPLERLLVDAAPGLVAAIRHVAVACEAADTDQAATDLIERSLRNAGHDGSALIEAMCSGGLLHRPEDAAGKVLSLADDVTTDDLREALAETPDDEDEDDELFDADTVAARALLAAADALGDDSLLDRRARLALAREGLQVSRQVALTAAELSELVDADLDADTLAAAVRELTDHEPWGEVDGDVDEAALKQGVQQIAEIMERLPASHWGPLHHDIASYAVAAAQAAEDAVPAALHDRIATLSTELRGYVRMLTRSGRMKLVGMSVLGRSRRNVSGTPCSLRPTRDGPMSELEAVSMHRRCMCLCSDGTAVVLPHDALDAIYDEESDRLFENLSVLLELPGGLATPRHRVLASCTIPGSPGAFSVLLVSERGQGWVLPMDSLPSEPGARVQVPGDWASLDSDVRWAVPIEPGHDVLLASTGNRVLRVALSDVLAAPAGTSIPLIALGEDDRVAAVTDVDGADLRATCVLITSGGYGRRVRGDAFPRGRPGDRGVVGQKVGKRSGSLATIEAVRDGGDLVLATASGDVLRLAVRDIPWRQRDRVGVKLIMLDDGDSLVCACPF